MMQYIEEERLAEEQLRKMRETVENKKKELKQKKESGRRGTIRQMAGGRTGN